MCFQSTAPNSFKKGYMDFKLFKKIIDEGSKNGLKSIKLNWRGEPLMHPKIVDMVRYAKEKGVIEVMFNTNGQLLTEKLAKGLIDAGLDKIIFSMDGATKKTYEKIRRGADYDILVNNIKRMINLRNERKLRKPFVRVQTVKMQDTAKEINKFVEMWRPIVDYIAVLDYSNRGEKDSRGIKTEWYPTGRLPCPQPFQRLMVAFDGTALPCCFDWMNLNPVGDANKQTIKEIWNGEPLRKFRQMHKERRLNEIPLCKNCTLKISYDWKKKKVNEN